MLRLWEATWGCFRSFVLAPVRTPCGVAASLAYLPHNTLRYLRRSAAVLARSDRLEADFLGGANFRYTEFSEVALALLTLHT